MKIFNVQTKCHCISVRYLPDDCVPAVCVWGLPVGDLAGSAICVLATLYFSSTTSHPRIQNPCFKLQVFIIDFKAQQKGNASLGGDVDCLFFAVKRSKSVVNIP